MCLDELKLLYGDDYIINDKISIRHPTLEQIKDFGEQKYFSIISNLIAIPSDMKSILFESGIDYEEISEFELFLSLSKNLNIKDTNIILNNIDLSSLHVFINNENEEIFLSESSSFIDEIMILENDELDEFVTNIFGDNKNEVLNLINELKLQKIELDIFKSFFNENIFNMKFPKKNSVIIDKHIYILITNYIRKIHGFEKKIELAGNAFTKKMLIEEDKNNRQLNGKKEFKSILAPLIKGLVNCADFSYNFKNVWDLPISVFMDSVKQIQKLKNFNFTMSGIYAGTIDSKKINKKDLNWI